MATQPKKRDETPPTPLPPVALKKMDKFPPPSPPPSTPQPKPPAPVEFNSYENSNFEPPKQGIKTEPPKQAINAKPPPAPKQVIKAKPTPGLVRVEIFNPTENIYEQVAENIYDRVPDPYDRIPPRQFEYHEPKKTTHYDLLNHHKKIEPAYVPENLDLETSPLDDSGQCRGFEVTYDNRTFMEEPFRGDRNKPEPPSYVSDTRAEISGTSGTDSPNDTHLDTTNLTNISEKSDENDLDTYCYLPHDQSMHDMSSKSILGNSFTGNVMDGFDEIPYMDASFSSIVPPAPARLVPADNSDRSDSGCFTSDPESRTLTPSSSRRSSMSERTFNSLSDQSHPSDDGIGYEIGERFFPF